VGSSVEFIDKLSSWGEHDRVESRGSVGSPSREGILRGDGAVADMNTPVVEVEVECLWSAFSEGEGCCRFGGVGEAMQLGQAEGAMGVLDVAEDTAGNDRGELLIITDEPDTPATTDYELHGGVEGDGVGHAGFVDDHQRRRPDRWVHMPARRSAQVVADVFTLAGPDVAPVPQPTSFSTAHKGQASALSSSLADEDSPASDGP
jgi:hypothetical protein